MEGFASPRGRGSISFAAAGLVAALLSAALLPAMVYAQSGNVDPGSPAFQQDMRSDAGGNRHGMESDFYAERAYRNGKHVPQNVYDMAADQWRRVPRAVPRKGMKIQAAPISSLNGTVWLPIGPSPIDQNYSENGNNYTSNANGRVSAIAVSPFNANLIYCGSSGGGVWRTTDGGANWFPLYDQQVSLGVGEPSAIAIDPNDTNVLYVGTSGRFVLNISKGILKSTDGGASWIILGSGFPADNTGNAQTTFAGKSVNTIIVDPANSNVLYLAATNGLYRSIDGGQNWTKGTGTGAGGDARSLVLDTSSPANARVLFAGVSNVGIVRSTDGGQTWTPVLTPTTTPLSGLLGPGQGIGHCVVTLAPPTSPANPAGVQVVYATMEGTGTGTPDPVGLFMSTNQGGTWTQRTATGMPSGTQGGYDLEIGCDPASPGDGANDILYVAAVGIGRSSDSGSNFTGVGSGMHPDFHSKFVFFPIASNPSIVFTGNDGGIWKSTDDGANWSGSGKPGASATLNGGGLQTSLMYNIAVKQDVNGLITLTGLQDNGIDRYTGSIEWADTRGGDGWDVAFDYVNTDNAYHTGGFWEKPSCTRAFSSTDSGATWPTAISDGNITASELDCTIYAGLQVHAINTDPNNGGTIYVSGNSSLWQTTDGGSTFRNLNNFGNRVGEVAVARANSNVIAVGVRNQVWVSTNALASTVGPPSGVAFTNITRNLPGRDVTRVTIDPHDPTIIYATLTGFSGIPGTGHVYRTTIGGSAWADISPPVDMPVNAIALDGGSLPTTIYIGTDLGVMRSTDLGLSWTVLDDVHLPNVPVTDLDINEQAGVLRAATFGRGAWDFTTPSGPMIAVNAENGLAFGTACSDGTSTLNIQVYNVGTQDLVIYSVQRLFGSTDFTVAPRPPTPITISPNSEADFTVQFKPTTVGQNEQAQIRIRSTDPNAPSVDLMATGSGGVPTIATAIVDNGDFGDVCLGSYKDLDLTITNKGGCDLLINGITSSSPEFLTPSVNGYPLTVQTGTAIALPVRLQPTSLGSKTATLTVSSNDPAHPNVTVDLSGSVPPGDIRVTGSLDFGDVCAGTLAEKKISICNVGKCDLNVTSVAFEPACGDFTLVNSPFPAVLSHDSCADVTVRFTPTSDGPKSCTLVIRSDDPDTPVISLPVTGNTPVPMIDVSPDLAFAPTVIQRIAPCTTVLPFLISNKGTCNLKITAISISGPDAVFYSLTGLLSFPILLEPGHVVGEGDLGVVFAPDMVDRDLEAMVTVTYVSDPVTGATTSVTRSLCGEGVKTGARVLVTDGGVPLAHVERLQIQRINANRNRPQLDTIDVARNLDLVTVTPDPPCLPFQYHREYGTVSNPIQLLPGSYQITATAVVNGKRQRKTVGFDVTSCTFDPTIVIDF